MLRSHHLLSLTLASSLLLCPSTAAANPGGASRWRSSAGTP